MDLSRIPLVIHENLWLTTMIVVCVLSFSGGQQMAYVHHKRTASPLGRTNAIFMGMAVVAFATLVTGAIMLVDHYVGPTMVIGLIAMLLIEDAAWWVITIKEYA
jgi:hypothetical protein